MAIYTVERLLEEESLKGIRLASGRAGISREIANVNIIDNPDTYDWLSAGDFLLSTGYIFRDDPQIQRRLVRELADIGCSGLGIKTRRYLENVPACMIEEAERLGFPLVEIPYHYALSQVSNVINNAIFKREDTQLKKLIHIHNTLTQCALEGGGLEKIARIVSPLVRNPLIIVDSKWRLLAYSDMPENPKPLKSHLYLRKKERVFPQSFIKDVPREFGEFTKSIKRRYPDANGDVVCRILPVAADKSIYGYLVVWETVCKMTSMEYMALESCSTTVALERVKARQIEEIKHHLRQDFFDDLIQGRIESVNAASSLAEIHYMDVRKKYVCMLTKVSDPGTGPDPEGDGPQERDTFLQYKERLIAVIEDISYERRRETVSIHRGNLIITFIRIRREELGQKMSSLLGEFVTAVYDAAVRADPKSAVSIALGKPSPDFMEISKSYMQAKEALRISEQIDEGQHISYYEELMVYRLINSVQSRECLDEFCSNAIGRLCEYDEQNNTSLVETLEQYFQCNSNISTAARKMFLHRNTFIYRIEKIKGILGSELKDPEELLELQMGLHIMKVLKTLPRDSVQRPEAPGAEE